jgi:hypothetical protein
MMEGASHGIAAVDCFELFGFPEDAPNLRDASSPGGSRVWSALYSGLYSGVVYSGVEADPLGLLLAVGPSLSGAPLPEHPPTFAAAAQTARRRSVRGARRRRPAC